MIFDFFIQMFLNIMNWALDLFPEFDLQLEFPVFMQQGLGIVLYYVDMRPFLFLVSVVSFLFFGFLGFKLAIWLWKMLPLT